MRETGTLAETDASHQPRHSWRKSKNTYIL